MTLRHFGNSAEADEVAQEAFVQIYQSMEKFRQEGSLRAWVMAIARNQILLYFRNETRRRRLTGPIIPPEILEIDVTTTDADPFQHETAENGQSAGAIRMMLMRIRKQLGKCIRTKLQLER